VALDKAIEKGEEHRKPYYKAGRFDPSCRPHGGCPWCEGSRFLSKKKRIEEATQAQLEEVLQGIIQTV
jgi:hypothetical protein